MSTATEELGLRVTLTGNQQAASGLAQVAEAEKKVGDAAKQASTALDGAARSTEKLTSVSQSGAQSQRTFADALQQSQAAMQAQASGAGLLSGWMSKLVTGATAVTLAMSAMSAASWFGQMQDDARVTLARITNITGSLTEARAVYRGLYEDSVRLRVSQADTLQGYTRIAAAVQELGGTAEQARKINEAVIATAKISGVSSQEAAAAARQFAQALGSGVLQGDELRSILENNQELARQLARGLGVSVSSLRKMGEEGKLTADTVALAILGRLPEIESKLASVPLTSADAWEKLKTVMTAWVVNGDQVEMKAGAIATMMNSMADSIEEARKKAAKPIVISVVKVTENQEGAAFVSRGRSIRVNTLSPEENENELARLSASKRSMDAARLGLEQAGKTMIEQFEKYADSVALGSEKLQKALDKQRKDLAATRAKLEGALTSGDPQAAAKAQEQLTKLGEMSAKAFADAEKKINDARKSEANKANAEAKAANAARYQESIAAEEAYQAQLREALGSETAALKRHYDAGEMSAEQYYSALHAARMTNLAQVEESVRRELETAQNARAQGQANRKADVAKYLGELQKLRGQRETITAETEDAITAITKKALQERERLIAAANQHVLDYLNSSREIVRQMEAENDERRFELSLVGQTEQAQARMQAQRQAELTTRRALTQAYREYIAAMDKSISAEQDAAITDGYNKQVAGIKAAGAAQGELATQVLATRDAYGTLNSTVDSFLDAALKGFSSLKDWLKNQFFDFIKSQVLKPLIMQIVVSATGGVTGGAGGIGGSLLSSLLGGGGGAGGLLGGLFGGATGLGTFSTGFMNMLFGGAGLLGNLGTGLGAAGSMLGAGNILGGLAMGAGTLLPVVGAVAALVSVVKSMDPSKGQGMRAAWGPDQADLGGGRHTAFGWFDMHGDAPDQKGPWLDIIAKLDETFAARMTAAQIASATALMGTGRGAWHDYENGNASGSIGTVSKELMQTRFDAIFQTLNFTVLQEKLKGFTGTAEELAKWLATVGGMMQVLDDQAALVKATVGEVFNVDQLAALAKEGETLDATFTRVMTTFQATNGIAALLGKNVADAFGAVGLASLDARQNLVDLAGGISQLDQMSTYYYEHFYSESERTERQRAAALEAVNQTFATLNLTVPASRDEFRKLVEGLDLSTEAGRKMFVALMQIAPAFDLVTSAAAAATTAVARSNDYLNNFFSAEERAQMQRADAQNLVNKTFSDLNLTVPQTRDEFRRLVEGLDLNTEAGRKVWNALMAIAGAFATVTDAANASAAAVVNLGVGITEAMESGTQQAAARLQQMATIIDAGQEDLPTRLARKMAAAASLAADYDRQYNQRLIYTGGIVDSVAVALDTARGAMQAAASGFAGDLAAYTSLAAQYGAAKAEKLLQLEQWHRAQLTLAGNNAQMLLAIEQSYQAQRTQILNDATSTGLASLASTVQQWLNNLLLNNQLTSLTPEAQLAEARNQMLAAYSSGNGSDFTRAADAYLGLARNAYASSDAYQQIFAWVQAMARSLISGSTAPVNAPTGTGNGVSGSPGNPAGLGSASPGATDGLLTAQAQLLAEVKAAIIDDGAQTRDNATANADRIVAATSPAVGETRVAV